MDLLIKQAKIIDSKSEFNGQVMDVLISDGKIARIAPDIKSADVEIIESDSLHVSSGWLDFRANFCDPGFEQQETLESGLQTAAAGGFTAVMVTATTNPVVDSKSQVEYLLNKAKDNVVTIYPTGSLSENADGKNVSEMFDMYNSGAVAFSDNKQSIQNGDLLKKALLYTKPFGGLVMNYPNDKGFSKNGQMHEGVTSTTLGMKGIPAIAESLIISRDISIAEYTECPLHISGISAKESVDLVRSAKKRGLPITCDVAVHQLVLTDENLEEFDSNYKVLPPLRKEEDRLALIEGVLDGTIDVICSDHTPIAIENKKVEFEHADFGIIGLQTLFPLLNTNIAAKIDLASLITTLTENPRQILKLEPVSLEVGKAANITLFDPTLSWRYTFENNKSLSQNSPFLNSEFKGKVVGIYNKGILIRN